LGANIIPLGCLKNIVMSRIEKILEFINNGGEDSFLQHALALEYIKIEKYQEALVQFVSLLGREPDYVGSYYHLGKLYEKLGRLPEAIQTYEKGMAVAKQQSDKHSYNELMMAKEELED
jgi:tetratricopeptide (TPR) repeat protein